MEKKLLYTFLLSGVLLFAGCSKEHGTVSGERPAPLSENSPVGADSGKVPVGLPAPDVDGKVRIVFLGNSITAGYGLIGEKAFPALIQDKMLQENLPVTVVEAGTSGETSTGGLRKIDWLLGNQIDVLVLELGGNDGLRGIDLSLTEENLRGIIIKTLDRYPDCRIVVAGMQVPTNIGHEYTEAFREIYPRLAEEFGADLIPFILEGVGGIEEMNQPDGIHPTAEGHRRVAETVWTTLEPVISGVLEERGD